MPFYPVTLPDVTPACAEDAALELLGRAAWWRSRLSAWSGRRGGGRGQDGRTALTAAGTEKIRTGDVVVFCKSVAVARAVVRRDGRVQRHPGRRHALTLRKQPEARQAGQHRYDSGARSRRTTWHWCATRAERSRM
jgi:hypothetical protein